MNALSGYYGQINTYFIVPWRGGISVFVYYFNGTDEIILEDVEVRLKKLPNIWIRKTNVFGNVFFSADDLRFGEGMFTLEIDNEDLPENVVPPEPKEAYWISGRYVIVVFDLKTYEVVEKERERDLTWVAYIVSAWAVVMILSMVIYRNKKTVAELLKRIHLIGKKAKK